MTGPTLSAQNIKAALGQANQSQNLDKLSQIIDALPTGTRFIVRSKRKCAIPIMGWEHNQPGGKITQRATVIDPAHTFTGVGFVFSPDGRLSLLAGHQPHQPWAVLPFTDQEDAYCFELAIAPPGVTTEQAQFV